ncbi:alpha/beta hydrolase [Cohnella kolymensis]|uniref:Alpha/beta hydrolase n=1 Tax=Cohnella kolymensis TaxID=1590652 RepID=A0ABR5A7E2_9BACL|nr:alpha/beta hydrolase [Cohnella kolymensis]KIL36890.1 alpha/beta hydrolase [Cohnella kolymensis]
MKKVHLSTGKMIAYDEAGTGTPIVLLHGYCGSHHYWDDVIPLLSARYRVIAPDLRGHGASSASEGVYTMEQLAGDTAELMDELKLQKVYLLGHSLGGYISLAFAEQYPDRLLGFGLMHSTSLADSETAKENRVKAVETIQTKGVNAFVDGLIPKLFSEEHKKSKSHKVDQAKEIGYATSPQAAVGCALGMRQRPDRTAVLSGSDLPVLLLAGEQDAVIPPENRFPVSDDNITAITLKDAAHMGMMETPQAFAEAILEFLDRKGSR